MVDYMDWAAAMDSEIFREYMRNEIPKMAQNQNEKLASDLEAKVDAELKVYDDLESFENLIKASPELLTQFRAVKAKILENPEIMKKADPNFVEGILMLDLEDENDS